MVDGKPRTKGGRMILLLVFATHLVMFFFGGLTFWFVTDERLVSNRKNRRWERAIVYGSARSRRAVTFGKNSRDWISHDPGLHR